MLYRRKHVQNVVSGYGRQDDWSCRKDSVHDQRVACACVSFGEMGHRFLMEQPAAMDFAELRRIYFSPFFELIQRARTISLCHWPKDEVQLCTLLSIKTGGCSEDCAYCAQSARYKTGVQAGKLMDPEQVLETARQRSEERRVGKGV